VTTASDAPGFKPSTWKLQRLNVTVRTFCGGCNNGWMSQLEADMRPLLRDLVQGHPVVMSPLQQERVAAWVHKTALVLSLTNRSGYQYFTAEDYSTFHAHRCPPAGTQIWLAAYDGPQQWTTWTRRRAVEITHKPSGEQRDGYVMIATLGRLVLAQVSSRWDTPPPGWKGVPPRFARLLVSAWPRSAQSRTWPPPDTLDEIGLQQLSDFFSVGFDATKPGPLSRP
jgi:hypothetical protein